MQPPPIPGPIAEWRSAERRRLRGERLLLSADERNEHAASLTQHLDALLAGRFKTLESLVISTYWPIKAELDLRPWMASLSQRGANVALPVVVTVAAPLQFRLWQPGLRLEKGVWNIPVPPASAASVQPQISLAPLVGWDKAGYRLGYGGGYFDRTLAALQPRPFVIGVGLQSAQIPTIQPQPHDIPLDAIVTEQGVQVLRH